MVDKTKCYIESRDDTTILVYLGVGTDIERKDAEEIIEKFKDHKYIVANIQKGKDYDIFSVYAKSPKVTVDCRRPEDKQRPLKYALSRL